MCVPLLPYKAAETRERAARIDRVRAELARTRGAFAVDLEIVNEHADDHEVVAVHTSDKDTSDKVGNSIFQNEGGINSSSSSSRVTQEAPSKRPRREDGEHGAELK